mmetsp:Transcript_16170/g.63052  ORF Transcript_16170/g.63052 Transcript_16170/m.63052 type:complete len:338 (+) Transcript_16170:1663-2676(+)
MEVALLQEGGIAAGRRVEARAHNLLQMGAERVVQEEAGGVRLERVVDLVRELEDELVEAEVHLCLNFVVEELLLERGERAVRRVVVDVQRVEDVLHHRARARLQDRVCQNPRQREVDGELQPLGELQVELTVPEVAQVCHLQHCALEVQHQRVEERPLVEVLQRLHQLLTAQILLRVRSLAVKAGTEEAKDSSADELELRCGGADGLDLGGELGSSSLLLAADLHAEVVGSGAADIVCAKVAELDQLLLGVGTLLLDGEGGHFLHVPLDELLQLCVDVRAHDGAERRVCLDHAACHALEHADELGQRKALLLAVVPPHHLLVGVLRQMLRVALRVGV